MRWLLVGATLATMAFSWPAPPAPAVVPEAPALCKAIRSAPGQVVARSPYLRWVWGQCVRYWGSDPRRW